MIDCCAKIQELSGLSVSYTGFFLFHFSSMMPSRADVCSLKTIVSLSFAITVAATPSQGTSAVLPLSLASDNGLQPEWPPPTTTSTSILNLTTTTTTTTITTTTQPDSVSYWNNGSNENNETSLFQLGDTSDSYNTSSYNLTEVQCEEWQYAQYTLFQTASLFFAIAFLIPHNFKLNMLLMRSVLSCGFLMFTIWGGVTICAPDIFAWNLIFVIINMTHVIYLGYKHFPPRVKPEYVDLYTKIFKPLNMDKNHFKELVKDAELLIIEEGAHYSVEDVTSADERLSILLYGKYEALLIHFLNKFLVAILLFKIYCLKRNLRSILNENHLI